MIRTGANDPHHAVQYGGMSAVSIRQQKLVTVQEKARYRKESEISDGGAPCRFLPSPAGFPHDDVAKGSSRVQLTRKPKREETGERASA